MSITGDIRSARLLWIKGVLFLLLGMLASVIMLVLFPDIRLAVLLAIAVWAFSRAYYFAFYVVTHYIDPSFRFAGLTSVLRYLLSRKDQQGGGDAR